MNLIYVCAGMVELTEPTPSVTIKGESPSPVNIRNENSLKMKCTIRDWASATAQESVVLHLACIDRQQSSEKFITLVFTKRMPSPSVINYKNIHYSQEVNQNENILSFKVPLLTINNNCDYICYLEIPQKSSNTVNFSILGKLSIRFLIFSRLIVQNELIYFVSSKDYHNVVYFVVLKKIPANETPFY